MLIGMIMALGLIAPQLVRASNTDSPSAQLVVNTAVDENDGSCSDGDCSLRDAIAVAADGDIITFAGRLYHLPEQPVDDHQPPNDRWQWIHRQSQRR